MIHEKPAMEMTRHIRPLYVKAHLNGKLVDNVMPLRMLRVLGMRIDDLIETKVSISAFTGEITKTFGILPLDITIGSKTSLSAFFIIDSTINYNIFLWMNWIHANWCVSSSLHQFLHFWKGFKVEVVWADKQPFILTTDSIEARYYDEEFDPIKFKRKNYFPTM